MEQENEGNKTKSYRPVYTNTDVSFHAEAANNTGWVGLDLLAGKVECSENAKRLMGFTTEQGADTLNGWYKSIHLDDLLSLQEYYLQAIQEHHEFNAEFRIIRSDGEIRWLRGIGRIFYDELNHDLAISCSGFITDITELKRTNLSLQLSEGHLKLLLANSSEAIYRMDTDWQVMENLTSKGFLPNTSSSNARWLREYIPQEDQQDVLAAIQNAINTKSVFELEHRVIQADGTIGWVTSRAVPLLDIYGEIKEWFGAASDITHRKEAQEHLVVSEERLRLAIETGGIGTCDWNYTTGFMKWNRIRFHMYGIKPQDRLIHLDEFFPLIHQDDREKVKESLTTHLEQTGYHAEEYRIICPNGNIHWIVEKGKVVEWKNKRPARVISILFDVTKRKRLEQQKDDFLNIASHELKTPVTSIKAYTQVMLDIFTSTDDRPNMRMIQKMSGQVDRLINLISNLLDTTTIFEGQLSLHIKTFNFNDLFNECIEELQHLSSNHKLMVHPCQLAPITADRERIKQVLFNLVSNAIKYSPKGKEILIKCEHTGDSCKISIEDNGIGISEEIQHNVFDRFFRAPDLKMQTFPGLGLGLYISTGIIHQHGGEIGVDSKLGEGSTFWFTLPIAL